MIDGIWWLVILFLVLGALWLLAHLRGKKIANRAVDKDTINQSDKKISPITSNPALKKTAELLRQHFPQYKVTLKSNHVSLSEYGQKIAMLTIDKKIAIGQRRLGDVMVINYHRPPTRAQLDAHLKNPQ